LFSGEAYELARRWFTANKQVLYRSSAPFNQADTFLRFFSSASFSRQVFKKPQLQMRE
jgi:hypothetical protein